MCIQPRWSKRNKSAISHHYFIADNALEHLFHRRYLALRNHQSPASRRMKACFTILILLLIQIVVFAQPSIQWQKTFGGNKYDEPRCIIQTTDGGYIVTGKTLSTNGDISGNHGDYDLWVIKLDDLGEIQL
jgi:hypothetical protein